MGMGPTPNAQELLGNWELGVDCGYLFLAAFFFAPLAFFAI